MIRCHFCPTMVDDVPTAIQANWIPSFYIDDREVTEPVCPSCTAARLRMSDDGVLELAPHSGFVDEAESAERTGAWTRAAALWQTAADKCQDAELRRRFESDTARCHREAEADDVLAAIAQEVLGVPTLDADRPREVGVRNLKQALRLAYQAGREAPRP